jgi:hypothetical protein
MLRRQSVIVKFVDPERPLPARRQVQMQEKCG